MSQERMRQSCRKFTPDEDAMILDAYRAGRKVSVPGRGYETLRGRLSLLLKRLGEKPAEPLWKQWSQAELLACWKMHINGKSNVEVGVAIGRTAKAVRSKIEQIHRGDVPNPEGFQADDAEAEPVAKKKKRKDQPGLAESANSPAMRRCLRCGDLFQSAHAGNRICSGCSTANRAIGLSANFNNAESWG